MSFIIRCGLGAVAVFILALAVGALGLVSADDLPPAHPARLTYTTDGRAVFPADYRDWPFLSAGLDMTYSGGGTGMDHHMFDNVFVDPDSLAAFRRTGHWPDGTVFVREDRMASSKGSINKAGQFQTEDTMGIELHVRDAGRFSGGWGFFFFGDQKPAQVIPAQAACYACHQAHGAVDTTFTQFYPTLIGIAKAKGTVTAD